MSGVCPKCIEYRDDDRLCPICHSGLLSSEEWKNQRDSWIALAHSQTDSDLDSGYAALNDVLDDTVNSTDSIQQKKDLVLGFFFGALLFFLALISSYLIFADHLKL